MTSAQKKFYRYMISLAMMPFAIIILPFYTAYQRIFKKRAIKSKAKDIVDGFSYLVIEDSEVEKKAKARAEVCAGCKFAKYNGKLNTIVVDNKTHKIKGMYCGVCSCSLSAKVRSDDSCPLGKW
jgi:hypothetical protein